MYINTYFLTVGEVAIRQAPCQYVHHPLRHSKDNSECTLLLFPMHSTICLVPNMHHSCLLKTDQLKGGSYCSNPGKLKKVAWSACPKDALMLVKTKIKWKVTPDYVNHSQKSSFSMGER